MTDVVEFKVGCNFDPELLEGIADLNRRYSPQRRSGSWRVTELFGSLPSVNPIGTARPSFRLVDAEQEFLKDYVVRAREHGIGLNYTLNISMVDPRTLNEKRKEIEAFLAWLEEIGVVRITVAHPLVGKIVDEQCTIPMEISTITQLRSVRQLLEWKTRFPRIDKLCVDVFANRDWKLLGQLSSAGHEIGVKLELLVNEFCVHDCIDRNNCYDIHSLDLSDTERKLFNNYPMGNCIRKRITEPVEWLRARFVLPQWIPEYVTNFDIKNFKISGRTHPTEYILWVTEQYLSGRYSGNLLELWADVENIGRAHDKYHEPRRKISVAKFPPDFLSFYYTEKPLDEENEFLERLLEKAAA